MYLALGLYSISRRGLVSSTLGEKWIRLRVEGTHFSNLTTYGRNGWCLVNSHVR